MTLKNRLFIFILFTCLSPLYSQNVGFEAGYNLSNMSDNISSRSLVGFNVGIVADLMEEQKFFHINTGLKYTLKGTKGYNPFTK